MDCRAGRRSGEPIGSSAIEATCRQYQCRFKRSGQFWSTGGDESLLCLDTFWRNGRWDLLFPPPHRPTLQKTEMRHYGHPPQHIPGDFVWDLCGIPLFRGEMVPRVGVEPTNLAGSHQSRFFQLLSCVQKDDPSSKVSKNCRSVLRAESSSFLGAAYLGQ
jgi:hypothetical protein